MAAVLDQPVAIDAPPGGDAVNITPPQSVNGKKETPEGAPSELSDLELDPNATSAATQSGTVEPEEEEEIEPDHYYGDGKIPVFKPTMNQFRDFQKFIHKVDDYGMKSGIIKVIPPKEWTQSLHSLDEAIKTIRVKNPIMQEFHGSHGTYTQANIERQRSYNLPQWKALCDESSHQPPARRGERRRNLEKAPRPAAPKPQVPKSDQPVQKRRPGRPPKRPKEPKVVVKKEEPPAEDTTEKTKPEGPPTPVSPASHPVETKTEELSDGEALPAAKPKGRQPKSVSARRKHNRGEALDHIDEEAFANFDYRIHDNDQYTAERCEELETAYWKSLMFNNPLYGADMPGSLFHESTECWNVAKLPNLLDVIGQKVPGVNTAYLYLGMWKATFAWHLEDVDLYSINYIHFGAPKQWYSISQEDAPRFEAAMRSIWPSDAKNCNQFLRHKTYLISPSILKSQFGITVNRLVHYEGEFVITYPYGYHSGYNLGYNCAESVNFATEKWLDYGRIAKKCNCESDSVWIDVDDIERKLRGEATPEYYDEFDLDSDLDDLDGVSDLLTPPRSVLEKSSTRGRKRRREGDETKPKRARIHPDVVRKIPCLLCPNNLDYEDLLPTEDGKSHAHRRCAMYIEETSILRDESGREVVCDIDLIPKARFALKCLFCREVRGACFQCNFGKCTRAYHPTCALLAGVQVEFGSVVVVADDGNQYSVPSVDLKCKFHRQKRVSWNTSEQAEDERKQLQAAQKLAIGELLQFQVDKEINGAVVLQNRPEERTLLLKVLPRGDVIELPYRWMLVVRKSSFPPLPPGTTPLPGHLARKAETRKDWLSAVPQPGAPFCDPNAPYQWAEFETYGPPPFDKENGVSQNNQNNGDLLIWHYLGQTSTDSRAQYTHNPSVPVHNPRANFLDSVKATIIPVSVLSAGSASTSPYAHPTKSYQSAAGVQAAHYTGGISPHPNYHHRAHHHHQFSLTSPTAKTRPPTSTGPPRTASAAAPAATAAATTKNNTPANPTTTTTTTDSATATAATASAPPNPNNSMPPLSRSSSTSLSSLPRRLLAPSAMTSAFRPLLPPNSPLNVSSHTASHHIYSHLHPHVSRPTSFAASFPRSQPQSDHQSLPVNNFANVRELVGRRRLAQLTEHANVLAGYTIVSPELVVETLLGPMGSVPPASGIEKLELAMAQQRVQPKANDGTLLPYQPLNMRSDEVTRLLQMLRWVLGNYRAERDLLAKREPDYLKHEPYDRSNLTAARLAGKFPYLDQQRALRPTVYRSPYASPFGFADWTKTEYDLPQDENPPPKESIANDYFASLSPEDQEKIMKTCGSFVQQRIERSASHSRQSSTSNFRLSTALAQQNHNHQNNPTIDITTVEDVTMSGLDFPLHADSPASSFSRAQMGFPSFPSPNDFTNHGDHDLSIVPRHLQDHHDLFGDQQANTRFWQNGPWAAGDGTTPLEENRPFFGPHERLKHDYAASELSLGRGGPGSLHSVDMAAFGMDGPEELGNALSPEPT